MNNWNSVTLKLIYITSQFLIALTVFDTCVIPKLYFNSSGTCHIIWLLRHPECSWPSSKSNR